MYVQKFAIKIIVVNYFQNNVRNVKFNVMLGLNQDVFYLKIKKIMSILINYIKIF